MPSDWPYIFAVLEIYACIYIYGHARRAYMTCSAYVHSQGPSQSPLALICRYLGAGGQIYRGGYINVAEQ